MEISKNKTMKRLRTGIVLLLFIALIFSCNTDNGSTLDMAEYFQLADSASIYPSDRQMQLLGSFMPGNSYQPAPPASDRDYWDKIAGSASGKEYVNKAISELDKKPEVPITDEIYRRANLEGNRGIYKPRYYRTMECLENFMLAECIENEGRFLPQISVYLRAIMDMKSWLHPNHDDRDNSVLEGRSMAIDLGARKFGTDLALAEVLLGDKLTDGMRKEISDKLRRRIIDCYLEGCSGEQEPHLHWFRGTSNWNSVCTSGSLFVTISVSNDTDERLAAVGCALNSMEKYLSGFGEDGYCSEGTGYWNYGFGHYLYLAQMVYDYTEGKINLLEADNPEKLRNVGNFPENYHIQNGTCAPFSDGSSRVSRGRGFASLMSAKYYGASLPSGKREPSIIISDEAAYQLIAWAHPEVFIADNHVDTAVPESPDYSYFDEFGMVISRGTQEVPFSIAIKAGHNDENHNHSDVGTYTIVLDRDFITGDIGAPSYIAGAFSPDNKARSSWGHPVPRIDNTLQSNGREFSGLITGTEFSEAYDKVVMDIKAAYEVPSLEKLTRTMENHKSGLGSISIEDHFISTEPLEFGIAIMTFAQYEITDPGTIILTSEDHKVKAEITAEGASIKIVDEQVPVEHLREGDRAYRIGIDFTEPISEGRITVRYTPVITKD